MMVQSISSKASKNLLRKSDILNFLTSRLYAVDASSLQATATPAHLSPFATALADFMAPTNHEQKQDEEMMARQPSGPMWSDRLSFVSPMTDFTGEKAANKNLQTKLEWSEGLSFASPEADYTSAPSLANSKEWSGDLSFASPHADFVAADVAHSPEVKSAEWSQLLSHSSSESDFVAATSRELAEETASINSKENFIGHVVVDKNHRTTMANSFSFAEAESDFTSKHIADFANTTATALKKSIDLPKTFAEAMAPTNEAIVITEPMAPFKIVEVNAAWEGLCGYTREESVGMTLGLLQGPETDRDAASALIDTVMKEQKEVAQVLTNYSKSGRKFTNNLRVGVLRDEDGDRITHFVGMLQDMERVQASA